MCWDVLTRFASEGVSVLDGASLSLLRLGPSVL